MKLPLSPLLLLTTSLLPTTILAQTWSACNPTNTTITCAPNPALGTNHTFVFNTSTSVTSTFNITAGALNYTSNGTQFTINAKGDSPTIQSQFYIFFGSVSVVMKAATGQGVISSIVLESDDLDEVDWEFLGGNGTHAETNYFGKGNTTAYDRAIYYPIPEGADPRADFHNYTVHWTAAEIQWYIDDTLVRTLPYASANAGKNFPQTPMNIRLGIWAGGDVNNSAGTIEWAGGLTDYTQGPYIMTVQSARVSDFGVGKEYEWMDTTGDWTSIKSIAGNSTALNTINNPSSVLAATSTNATNGTTTAASSSSSNTTSDLSIAQKFEALPTTTKLAIYAGSAGAGALLFIACIFSCIRASQKASREQAALAEERERKEGKDWKEQMELKEKGLGGWDEGSRLGDDALGGWVGGGTHVGPGVKAVDVPDNGKSAAVVTTRELLSTRELPSRVNTPMGMGMRGMDPVSRIQTPNIVSPMPQSPIPSLPRSWTGSNSNGMNQQATSPFSDVNPNSNYARASPAPTQRSYSSNQSPNTGYSVTGQTQRGFGGNGGGGYARYQGYDERMI